jgi:predicted nucleotidyltransferase
MDISAVAARMREQDRAQATERAARYATAQEDLQRVIEVVRRYPEITRVRTWGSMLRPDRFTELSDVDVCVEGISSPQTWSRLERDLLDVVRLPLDLVRWETLMEPHRESIVARGKVVYESA